jgi:hypothetical protein
MSRIAGSLSFATMLLAGATTNCGDVDTTGPPQPRTVAPGTSEAVAGCADANRFRAFTSLRRPEQCDGTSAGGLELKLYPAILGQCPDAETHAVAAPFQIYWTICNSADRVPPTVLDYQLAISTVQAGAESPFRTLPFTQPSLLPCECKTEVVVFNSSTDPSPDKGLGPGAYRFRLTAPYALATVEQATVANP